jgi:serine protease AprX
LQETYTQSIHASDVWGIYKGTGVGVAVVDSGIHLGMDFTDAMSNTRIMAQVKFNSQTTNMSDMYGHGTHVAGIIGGRGVNSSGGYVGVAPDVNLINVKVSDDTGNAAVSDVVNGLQWVLDNKATYNIRVVNLSLNSTVADSYQVDPLDAAVETLWKAGIVVVASTGNNGTSNAGVVYAPANDPFVITVGAVNDQGTASTSDDTLASFSSYGTIPVSTTAGLTTNMSKPDLVAPGVNIISDLASSGTTLAKAHPANVINNYYFRMSGTSMAAPMVAGAAALLLQSNPTLTPNQVKYRLMSTAQAVGTKTGVGAGEANVAAAIKSTSTSSANSGYAWAASIQPGNPAANWGSVSWSSASWSSASWSSDFWG